LRRWEDLRPELDAFGVELVAISADTPEQIRKGRAKHGSQAVMLADPDLEVTTRYNLRNERNLAPKPGVITALPIPVTFLVDAAGIVRWIDQAEDYQIRSHPERVLGAIRENLS
jgi:peroxiredoxin